MQALEWVNAGGRCSVARSRGEANGRGEVNTAAMGLRQATGRPAGGRTSQTMCTPSKGAVSGAFGKTDELLWGRSMAGGQDMERRRQRQGRGKTAAHHGDDDGKAAGGLGRSGGEAEEAPWRRASEGRGWDERALA